MGTMEKNRSFRHVSSPFSVLFLGQFGKNGSKPCYCGKALKPKAPLGMVLNCFEYLPK